MVIKSVNDQSPKSEYQSKEIPQDSPEDEDAQLQHPTREERLMKYKNQCENLMAYLTTSVCPQGLSGVILVKKFVTKRICSCREIFF